MDKLLEETKYLMKKYKIKANKSLGQNFLIDEKVISQTNGIIQGMSGSPIIQNNKIIGAVTHVIINEPVTGYGIFITTMLETGEAN